MLYEQVGTPAAGIASAVVSQEPSKTSQGADDFTLSKEAPIGSVEVFGSGSAPSTTVAVWIYADGGTTPGAEVFHQAGLPETGGPGDFTVHLTGAPTLAPGSYWLSMQLSTFGYWNSMTAQHGDPAVWQNPAGGYGLGCPTYEVLSGCGATGKDFTFRVFGPDPVVPPEVKKVSILLPEHKFFLGKVRRTRNGSARIGATATEAGTVLVADQRRAHPRIKRRSIKVSEPGKVQLPVLPTAASLARLETGKKVPVEVRISYRAADGSVDAGTVHLSLARRSA